MAKHNPLTSALKETAIQLELAEELIEKVVAHKWKEVHQAQYLYKSIEDSGLGKFTVRPKVVIKKIEENTRIVDAFLKQLQDGSELSSKEVQKRQRAIEGMTEAIKHLQTKI